jgi:nanoRNase/pAp phosphatase (c-di-AMP/oligoRNAs hydrolase)
MSLYNIYDNDNFNCGTYLKENYNGGGHVGAAGCTITNTKFIKILKTKKI